MSRGEHKRLHGEAGAGFARVGMETRTLPSPEQICPISRKWFSVARSTKRSHVSGESVAYNKYGIRGAGDSLEMYPIFSCTSQDVTFTQEMRFNIHKCQSCLHVSQMRYPTYFLRLFLLHALRTVPTTSLGQTEERKPSSLPSCYISITHVRLFVQRFPIILGGKSGLVMIRLLLPYPKKRNRAPKKHREERIA